MKNSKNYEGIILSIVMCFMLFVYAPLELFFMNQDEFFFDVYILLPVLLVLFGLILIPCMIVFALLKRKSEKAYTISLSLFFIMFICSYIQGNFLVKNLPILDGAWVEWNEYPMERLKCIGVWCIVSLIVWGAYRKLKVNTLKKGICLCSTCMGLMLLITIITLGVSEGHFEKKVILNTTTKDLFTMSSDQNFVILVLDAVDAKSLAEVIESNPKYSDIFDDFTAFNNTVGATPSTRESIPYLLSGIWYENQILFENYEKQAYNQSPLLKTLESEGYRMGLYEEELMLNDEGKERFNNIVICERGVNSYITFARWQIQMVGFKYAPFDLKRFCFVNPAAFNTLKLSPNEEEQFLASNIMFYERTKDEQISLTTDKCFKFIHLEGGHVPFQYNEAVERIDNGTYEDNLKACLTITNAYLNMLRNCGVYDNSVIIVMADHGYRNSMRANPILYVKGIDEQHEFSISDAPISYEDLQDAYIRLLQGSGSNETFPYQEGDVRERRFLCDIDGGDIVEYVQKGHATNMETMEETGNVYRLKEK